jgi:cytochrome c oxidase assembly protein subunit 15
MSKNASAMPPAAVSIFRLAALFTFLAVAMGALVCATGSGASCPTWPGCRPNEIAPPWALSPLIEFTHRVVAVTSGPLVLAAAAVSTRLHGPNRWVRILPWVALAGALAAGAFGRVAVLSVLPTGLGALDLFCALIAMTAMGVAAVLVATPAPQAPSRSGAELAPVRVRRLAATSLAVVIVMHVTGIFAAGPHSYTRCLGWPIWALIDNDLHPWLQDIRLGLAVLAAVLVVFTAIAAGRDQRLRGWGILIGALFAAEMVLGLVIRARVLNTGVAAAYSVLAVALVSCLGLVVALTWPAPGNSDPSAQLPAQPHREPVEPGMR